MKSTAEAVTQALLDAQTAQTSAEKAIAKAKTDIGEARNRLTQVTTTHLVFVRFYALMKDIAKAIK